MTPVAAVRQKVALRVYRDGDRSRIRTVRVPVRADGIFARRMPTRRKGRLSVRVLHRATPELAAARGPEGRRRRRRGAAPPRASPARWCACCSAGSRQLHYAVPRNGAASTPRPAAR